MAGVRGRWTRTQARRVVEEFEGSGESMAEFARRRGLHPERLRRWRSRLRREGVEGGPRLVELVASGRATQVGIRVHCPSGHVVEVTEADLESGLRAVMAAVAAVSGC